MLYKVDSNLDIEGIISNYNIIILLSNDMFYTKCIIDTMQELLGYKGVSELDLDGFGIMGNVVDIKRGYTSLNDYINNIVTPSLYGRHFYVCDYGGLSANDIKKLHTYSNNSSSNGLLVVTVSDYKSFNKFRGKDYVNNPRVMVLYGYISNSVLKPLLKGYLYRNNISYDTESTLESLMYRVGMDHKVYFDLISRLDSYGGKLTDDILKNELRDIQSVDILDLLELILKNKSAKKLLKKNKIYKTLDLLLSKYTMGSIVTKMCYYLDDLIKLRDLVNRGKIPLVKNIDLDKALLTLGDNFNNISAYRLGKYISIIEDTSLVELLCIQFLLKERVYSELGNYNKLLGVINRYSIKGVEI